LQLSWVGYTKGGQQLLHDITFSLEAGRNTIVLGPNGAGKSLLLRLCHGLIQPSSGILRWCGPAAAETEQRQAMVFQRPVLLRRSVAANIEYPLSLRRMPRQLRAERVQQALEISGLESLASRFARVLSTGEQQRLALARAWAVHPEVLFLDEPTASLDPAATRAVEELIQKFRAAGVKVVMTTHNLGQARRLADEILFLHHGQLLEQGPADAFFKHPASRDAQAFLKDQLLW
jgi:tungstate transport system ATP-binding protein